MRDWCGTDRNMIKRLNKTSVDSLKAQTKRYKCWDVNVKNFFVRVYPSGIKSYAIFYRFNGRDCEYTIGKHGSITVDQARTIAVKKLGQVAGGTDIQADKKSKIVKFKAKKYQTLGGFIEHKYKDWVLTERKAGQGTLNKLAQSFTHLYTRDMAKITPWDVQKWRTGEIKRGLKPSTINRQLVALKAVLSKAVEWEILDRHPLHSVKQLKIDSKSKVRYLSDAEEKRLRRALDAREAKIRSERASGNQWRQERGKPLLEDMNSRAFSDHLRPMVLIALNTGMRRGELFGLTWEDVNLKKRYLTIAGKTAKTGATRHIPLNDEALGTLLAWRNATDSKHLVFPNPNTGKRFDNISTAWQQILKDAKIIDFRFHDCRHHFASQLAMKGCDLNVIRELLGHSDISMTLRYAHLAPEHKAAAVALLNN